MRLLLLFSCSLWLAMCGQKGPLYLPDKHAAAQPPVAQAPHTMPVLPAGTA